MLKEFLNQFKQEEIVDFTNVIKIGNRFYLKNESSKLKNDPTYLGTFLGENIRKNFKPSFILLDMLKDKVTSIRVSDEQAWLFVCGKDILDPLTDRPENTLVFVLTQREEVLGFGKIKKHPQFIARNILDRGDFLRRES